MKILKETDVIEKTTLSHPTLYRLIKADKFPSSIRLSKNRVGWIEDEVNKWLEEQQKVSKSN